MSGFEQGAIYNYNYLWLRESQRGEETGRKSRPTCLVLKSASDPERLYLFALTTRRPDSENGALEVPTAERRMGGLDQPCWLVLDEYNVASADQPHDFASVAAIGHFSRAFLQRIAAAFQEEARKRRPTAIPRT